MHAISTKILMENIQFLATTMNFCWDSMMKFVNAESNAIRMCVVCVRVCLDVFVESSDQKLCAQILS